MAVAKNQADERLLRLAVKGDAAAFRALLDAYYPVIYRMAFRLTATRHDAEDVTQMASMKIAQNIGTFKGESSFSTWIYTIVLNSYRDWKRTQSRHYADNIDDLTDLEAGAPDPENLMGLSEEMRRINALPEPEREIVFLVFGEGLTHKEAGKIIGCAESTISWRIHEARKILSKSEGKHGHG